MMAKDFEYVAELFSPLTFRKIETRKKVKVFIFKITIWSLG
jgi:hypothetical protein